MAATQCFCVLRVFALLPCGIWAARVARKTHSHLAVAENISVMADWQALDVTPPPCQLVERYHPIFDYDGDGCLPAAAISRWGEANPGLRTSGSITGSCRESNWYDLSNTYHRFARALSGGSEYQAHVFEMYFEKDQIFHGCCGHRHDVEAVLMYFKDGVPVAVGASAHGDFDWKSWADAPKEDDHPKIVYHKDGIRTHAFRHAKANEQAENNMGRFLLPRLATWFAMKGDGLSNAEMRQRLNSFNFGSASFKLRDGRFESLVAESLPSGFPTFTDFSSAQC